jgi:hypothetical protein
MKYYGSGRHSSLCRYARRGSINIDCIWCEEIDKGSAGLKDMRADPLAPFIAAAIDPVQIHLNLTFWPDWGSELL